MTMETMLNSYFAIKEEFEDKHCALDAHLATLAANYHAIVKPKEWRDRYPDGDETFDIDILNGKQRLRISGKWYGNGDWDNVSVLLPYEYVIASTEGRIQYLADLAAEIEAADRAKEEAVAANLRASELATLAILKAKHER